MMNEEIIRIACVGDSITAGFGLEDWDDSYPNQLYCLLGDKYLVNPNLGKSGSAIWCNSLLPYTGTREYLEAVHWPADILIVCLGSNDTVSQITEQFCKEFKADYEELLKQLLIISPRAKVFLCTIPPIFRPENAPYAEKVPLINALITEVAESNSVQLIDLHTPLTSRYDLFPDGIHPNGEGAKIIAEIVYNAIK